MEAQDLFTSINTWATGTYLEYSLLATIIFIIVIFISAKIIYALIRKGFNRHYKGANVKVILRLFKILIYVIAGYSIFNLFIPFQGLLTTVAAFGGVITVVVGFAAQEAAGNFVNGMMITIFKPFKIGDLIKVNNGELVGTVTDISIRHTVIKTYENTKIVVPNSVMDKAILENVTAVGDQKANFLELEISYESDLDNAMKIIEQEVMRHENFMDIRSEEEKKKKVPAIITRLVAFNESGMQLKTTVYSKNNAQGFAMLSDLRIAIKKRFDEAGIDIPYPHRTLIMKEDAKQIQKKD